MPPLETDILGSIDGLKTVQHLIREFTSSVCLLIKQMILEQIEDSLDFKTVKGSM